MPKNKLVYIYRNDLPSNNLKGVIEWLNGLAENIKDVPLEQVQVHLYGDIYCSEIEICYYREMTKEEELHELEESI